MKRSFDNFLANTWTFIEFYRGSQDLQQLQILETKKERKKKKPAYQNSFPGRIISTINNKMATNNKKKDITRYNRFSELEI